MIVGYVAGVEISMMIAKPYSVPLLPEGRAELDKGK
jgi:hypothetical protein